MAVLVADDRWSLGMRRNRWLFPVILIALVALGTVGWLQRGTGGGTTAAGATTSPAAAAGCELAEMPNAEVDKEIWNSIARVHSGVLAAGTRYQGSHFDGIAAEGSNGGWRARTVSVWAPQLSSLNGVSGDGAQGAWAVGALNRGPAIARWNGDRWASMPVADPGPGLDALAGVAGLTPRLAWAVGRHDDGVAYRTLIERWDGTAWQRVPSPNVGSEPNSLNDVAVIGPDDAWAVGWHVPGQWYRPLVQHWDGSGWTVVPTPELGSGDAILSSVVARGPEDVWAVGSVTQADVPSPVVERWNGSRWARIPVPANAGSSAAFSAATLTPDGIAVVGRRIVDQEPQALAVLLDGASWHQIALTAAPSQQSWLASVTTDASGRLWAVGTRLSSGGFFGSLVVSGCGSA
jgi:hypothetical protein